MNKRTIITSMLMLCATMLMAQSEVFKVDDLYYRITADNAVAVAANGDIATQTNNYYADLESVVIPASVTYEDVTYDVTAIDEYAFAACAKLAYVELPGTITAIPDYAFVMSGLQSIIVPEGVTAIGQYAFGYCESLLQIQLPSTLLELGECTIYESRNIQMVICMAKTPALAPELYNTSHFLLIVPAGSLSLYKQSDAWDGYNTLEMGAVWIEVSYSDDPSHTLTFFGKVGETATIVIAEVGKQVEYILFNGELIERSELQLTTYPLEGLGEVPVCLFTTPQLVGNNIKDDALAGELNSKKAAVHIVYGEVTEVVTNPAAGELLGATKEAIDRTNCITVQYPGKPIASVDFNLITIAQGVESGVIVDQNEVPQSLRRQAPRDTQVFATEQTVVEGQGNDAFSFHPVWSIEEIGSDGVVYTHNYTTLPAGYCYVVKLAEGAVTFADDTKSKAYSWEFKMAIGTDVDEVIISGCLAFNGVEIVNADSENLILIYDMRGVLVASGRGRIDVSNLAHGLYIAKSGNETLKIAI